MNGMDASTARTLNIRAHVEAAGGPAEWARRYGGTRWQQPQVSQWISETKPKGIGGRLARDLEEAMGLARGELDRPPESQLVQPDLATIFRAMDFLEELFAARGKEFDRNRHQLLVAAVVDDLLRPEPLSVVQLSVKYGEAVDAGQDWQGDKAASAG